MLEWHVHVQCTCICINCVYMCMHAWCTACEHDMTEGPASSPPCSLGSCAVRQSCRHSWVLPAALTPATSVTPGTSSPPRSPLSSSAHPTLSRPGGGAGTVHSVPYYYYEPWKRCMYWCVRLVHNTGTYTTAQQLEIRGYGYMTCMNRLRFCL